MHRPIPKILLPAIDDLFLKDWLFFEKTARLLTQVWSWIHQEMDCTRPDCLAVYSCEHRERRECPSDSV